MQIWVKFTHWLLLKRETILTKLLINRKRIISIFLSLHAPTLEVCMGRIFRPGPKEELKFRPRPGPKGKLKYRPKSDPARNIIKNFGPSSFFFFRFHPRQLGLCDFKTGPFSCLCIINVFFCYWFIFLQIIKTTNLVLIAFS